MKHILVKLLLCISLTGTVLQTMCLEWEDVNQTAKTIIEKIQTLPEWQKKLLSGTITLGAGVLAGVINKKIDTIIFRQIARPEDYSGLYIQTDTNPKNQNQLITKKSEWIHYNSKCLVIHYIIGLMCTIATSKIDNYIQSKKLSLPLSTALCSWRNAFRCIPIVLLHPFDGYVLTNQTIEERKNTHSIKNTVDYFFN